jgi:hypothetical protein
MMKFKKYINEASRQLTGKEAVAKLKAALEKAGFGRTSSYRGAEITGWTNNLGSTGFSIRKDRDGKSINWNIVISGKKHLPYETYKEVRPGDDEVISLHRPLNPEKIKPDILKVFKKLKLKIKKFRYAGHQGMWDDDVEYEITTEWPDWLSEKN